MCNFFSFASCHSSWCRYCVQVIWWGNLEDWEEKFLHRIPQSRAALGVVSKLPAAFASPKLNRSSRVYHISYYWMNIQVDPTSSNLASAMLNFKIRPRAVVGYGVKILLSQSSKLRQQITWVGLGWPFLALEWKTRSSNLLSLIAWPFTHCIWDLLLFSFVLCMKTERMWIKKLSLRR